MKSDFSYLASSLKFHSDLNHSQDILLDKCLENFQKQNAIVKTKSMYDILDQLHNLCLLDGVPFDQEKTFKNLLSGGLVFHDSDGKVISDIFSNPKELLSVIFKLKPDFLSINFKESVSFEHKMVLSSLSHVILPYTKAFGLDFDLTSMSTNNDHILGMKADYSKLDDIEYYEISRLNQNTSKTIKFVVKIYFEPMEAFYKYTKQPINSQQFDRIDIGVYYKNLKSVIKPMLTHYISDVSRLLDYPVDAITDEIVNTLDMLII